MEEYVLEAKVFEVKLINAKDHPCSNFKVQSSSQKMPEQCGLLSTGLSTRRAPAAPVIPGFFLSVIPGHRPGDPPFKAQS